MKFLTTIALIISYNFSFSQSEKTIETAKDSVKTEVQTPKKEYSGGVNQFYKYIKDRFRVPNNSNFPGGKLIVEFTIKTDGSIGDIEIIKDLGFGTANQIKKILLRSPKWTPATQDGKPVESKLTLPIILDRGYDE